LWRLKAIQNSWQREKQGGLGVPINTPISNMDEHFTAQQHQNELRAFLRYEAKLKLAYARSQNPQSRRRHSAYNSWATEGICE